MKNKFLLTILLIFINLNTLFSAVIDFNTLIEYNKRIPNHIGYHEDGYHLTVEKNPYFAWREQEFENHDSYGTMFITRMNSEITGSPALTSSSVFVHPSQGFGFFELKTQSTFDIFSIDLNEGSVLTRDYRVEFWGTKEDNTKVYQTLDLDDLDGSETLYFNDNFTDLVSLNWKTGYVYMREPSNWVRFDNLVVSDSTAVPEPTTASIYYLTIITLFLKIIKSNKLSR